MHSGLNLTNQKILSNILIYNILLEKHLQDLSKITLRKNKFSKHVLSAQDFLGIRAEQRGFWRFNTYVGI